ncbi:MAG: hypothetical protein ACFCVE_06790, partial [Phycisphaerae bacterium]
DATVDAADAMNHANVADAGGGADASLGFGQTLGGQKEVERVILEGNARLGSVLNDPVGGLLRRSRLEAPRVEFDVPARRVVVPVPGRLLYQDNRPPEQPDPADANAVEADGAAAAPPAVAPGVAPGGLGNLRGATAVQWGDSLVYDEPARQAELTGGVRMAHEGIGDNARRLNLSAGRVKLTFLPAETDAPGEGGGEGGGEAGMPAGADLQRLQASGGVTYVSEQVSFEAATADYDATTGILVATGGEGAPVQVFDAQGRPQGTVRRLTYNVRTDEVKLEQFGGRGG